MGEACELHSEWVREESWPQAAQLLEGPVTWKQSCSAASGRDSKALLTLRLTRRARSEPPPQEDTLCFSEKLEAEEWPQ